MARPLSMLPWLTFVVAACFSLPLIGIKINVLFSFKYASYLISCQKLPSFSRRWLTALGYNGFIMTYYINIGYGTKAILKLAFEFLHW